MTRGPFAPSACRRGLRMPGAWTRGRPPGPNGALHTAPGCRILHLPWRGGNGRAGPAGGFGRMERLHPVPWWVLSQTVPYIRMPAPMLPHSPGKAA